LAARARAETEGCTVTAITLKDAKQTFGLGKTRDAYTTEREGRPGDRREGPEKKSSLSDEGCGAVKQSRVGKNFNKNGP